MISNSALTHQKNLPVLTLNPKGNSQIFLLAPFKDGVIREKNQFSILICQSRSNITFIKHYFLIL